MTIVTVKDVTQTLNVPFYGVDLAIVTYHGQPYVPMKLIVEGMGLNWASQLTKLKTRFQSCVVKITIQTKHGLRPVSCLALNELAGWLATINLNKVKTASKEKVIRYQEECDEVLQVYWVVSEAKRREQVKSQLPNCRYYVKMEVYDYYLKKTSSINGRTESVKGIIVEIARQYGYHIESMISLPARMF